MLWRTSIAIGRLLAVVAHLLHGMLVMAWRFPALDAAGRQQRIQWWSRRLLHLAGLELRVQGQPRTAGALLLANHVSWLDICAIHAACPQARFVSKADVLRWPLLGWLIKGAGTLFIERERKRDALRMVHDMAAALGRGETVAVFPEGTTGAGDHILPFHANLLQAAIAVQAPIQPVLLRFTEPGQPVSLSAQYIGDTTLVQSIWRVVSAQGLRVEVDFLDPQASAHGDRRALAEGVRQQLQMRLDEARRKG